MILKGSQREGGARLAAHLTNLADNDHIEIRALRGFIADDLFGAFKEAQAIALGTACSQYLFSLSLSPPEYAALAPEDFEAAADEIEARLGLTGQPRALIFHEKNGRRHAHCVWSRIDVASMTAIKLPFFKRQLTALSRELYLKHGWEMPPGLQRTEDRDPLNVSHAEHQQAKRTNQNARDLKKIMGDCWRASDNCPAFAHALLEHGLHLARGDRRGFVAVDVDGEVYAISRWVGVKARDVRAKLGDPDDLPSVDDVMARFADDGHPDASPSARSRWAAMQAEHSADNALFETQRQAMVDMHRSARSNLRQRQETRRAIELRERSAHVQSGLRGLWSRLTGANDHRLQQIEVDAAACDARDGEEWRDLLDRQLSERRALQQAHRLTLNNHRIAEAAMRRELGGVLKTLAEGASENPKADPAQPLILPDEDEAIASKSEIRRRPERVLDVISDKEATFSRSDIERKLATVIGDKAERATALARVLRSDELVTITSGDDPAYTTRSFQQAERDLAAITTGMADTHGFGVKSAHTHAALARQNADLKASVGATLSDEQTNAVRHVLGEDQISLINGLAGAGKSTALAAARMAWEAQGRTVIGAALAGKAADSLEAASGIQSRTLASLEASWDAGYEPIPPGGVLVVDEAGMIGTRQMARIGKGLAKRGAKLVLVGDPEQLQPINAGTPFRDIADRIGAADLTKIRRQKHGWQRQASLDLAQGRQSKALAAYAQRGAVDVAANGEAAINMLVADYMADLEWRGPAKTRLALAHRRRDVHAINQAIRRDRKASGDLAGEQMVKTKHGPRAFAPGDRILLTRNDTAAGLRNGMLGEVIDIGPDHLTFRPDVEGAGDSRPITIRPKHYRHFDHGYATTIHKSQGATVDAAFVLGSTTMDRHLTYVAMTRHREAVRLYADTRTARKMEISPAPHRYDHPHRHGPSM